jgi:hypothetical protein
VLLTATGAGAGGEKERGTALATVVGGGVAVGLTAVGVG